MQKDKGYRFLERGYTSFPLKDIGKKFEVVDTIDIEINKTHFINSNKINKLIQLHINQREIEEAIWQEIKKEYKGLFEKSDWLVISMIAEFGDKIRVSLDMLKEIENYLGKHT